MLCSPCSKKGFRVSGLGVLGCWGVWCRGLLVDGLSSRVREEVHEGFTT